MFFLKFDIDILLFAWYNVIEQKGKLQNKKAISPFLKFFEIFGAKKYIFNLSIIYIILLILKLTETVV